MARKKITDAGVVQVAPEPTDLIPIGRPGDPRALVISYDAVQASRTPREFGAAPIDLDADPSTWHDSSAALTAWLASAGPKIAYPNEVFCVTETVLAYGDQTILGKLRIQNGITGGGFNSPALKFRPTGDWTYTPIQSANAGDRVIVPTSTTGFAKNVVVHVVSNQWFNLRTKTPIGEAHIQRAATEGGTVSLEGKLRLSYRSYEIAQLTIAAGINYVAGDVLTVDGGTFSAACSIKVTRVDGAGTPIDWVPVSWGNYTVFPTGTRSLTGGSGSSGTCTVVASTIQAAAITPITVIADIEITGDEDYSQTGVVVEWGVGCDIKISGAYQKERLFVFNAGIGNTARVGSVRNNADTATSYGITVSGAVRNCKVYGGFGWDVRHFTTTNNPSSMSAYSGIPMDIDFLDSQVESTAVAVSYTALMTASASTDVISGDVASASTNITLRFSTTGTLPSPLLSATDYFAVQFASGQFVLYPTRIDRQEGTNQIDITTAGTGTHSVHRVSGGDALDTHSAAINVWYRNVKVQSSSSQGINMECCGGGVDGALINNTYANAIACHNENFYPALWRLRDIELADSGEDEGSHGLVVQSGYGTRDEVQLSGLKVRRASSISAYMLKRGVGELRVSQFDGVSVDSNDGTAGQVYFNGAAVGCCVNVDIRDVPPSGTGMRFLNVDGVPGCSGTITAAGDNSILVRLTTTDGCTINGLRLVGTGYSNVRGVFQDNDCDNSTIDTQTISFKDVATPLTVGSGTGHQVLRPNKVSGDNGDAGKALTLGTLAPRIQVWASPLTAPRAVTLSTTGAWNGGDWEFIRTAAATGASGLDIGGLKTLAVGQKCRATVNAAGAFMLTDFASL